MLGRSVESHKIDLGKPLSADHSATVNNAHYLLRYLAQKPEQIFYPKDLDHQLTSVDAVSSTNELFLRFSHDLVRISSQRWRDREYFLIIPEKPLGAGSFSDVFAIDKMLIVKKDGSWSYKDCQLILKKFIKSTYPYHDTLQKAMREYRSGVQADYFTIKLFAGIDDQYCRVPLYPVLAQLPANDLAVFYVTSRFPGQELFPLFFANYDEKVDDPYLLPMGFRYTLIDTMLRTYARQVYRQGLVHADIKPENAMILTDTDKPTEVAKIRAFNWCDFGFAHGQEEVFTDICGTPQYMAPEALKTSPTNTTAADIFSFGKIISLWIDNKDKGIQNLVRCMTDRNYSRRPLLAVVSFAFTKLHSDYQISSLDACTKVEAANAFKLAYHYIYAFNDPIRYYEQYRQGSRVPFNFRQFVHTFERLCSQIRDTPDVIKQVFLAFQDEIFAKCDSKQALSDTATEFIKAFLDNLLRYLHREEEVSQYLKEHPADNELEDLHFAMQKTRAKCEKASLFYDVTLMNDTLCKQLGKFEPILERRIPLSQPPVSRHMISTVAETITQYGIFKAKAAPKPVEEQLATLTLSSPKCVST